MGAWIEIFSLDNFQKGVESHPTWVRGLKFSPSFAAWLICVAPHVGAWIEMLSSTAFLLSKKSSHPTWVRGLKYDVRGPQAGLAGSHPTWVRGLKLQSVLITLSIIVSHPTWVRGLKCFGRVAHQHHQGRTPRGCVD